MSRIEKVYIIRDEANEFEVAFSTYDAAKTFLDAQKSLTALSLKKIFIDVPCEKTMSTCFVIDENKNLLDRYTKIWRDEENIVFFPVINRWLITFPGCVETEFAYNRCVEMINRYNKP